MRRLIYLLGFSLLGVILFFSVEAFLLFKPSPDFKAWPKTGSMSHAIILPTATEQQLVGRYLPVAHSKTYVLYLHGNQGNLADQYDALQQLRKNLHASILAIDYEGFGQSTGWPSEQNMVQDALLASHWLAKKEGISEKEIIVMGRSMGATIAAITASQIKARALILVSPLYSLAHFMHARHPFLWPKFLMRHTLNTKEALARYHGPLLILHSAQDRVIPLSEGRALFNAVTMPKMWHDTTGAHFSALTAADDTAIFHFIQQVLHHDFDPILILVSIDGLRALDLNATRMPYLWSLAASGARADLISVFPSVTFVNHYSIVTGLYPEHHGIMLNEFYAFDLHQFFRSRAHAALAKNPAFWKGEPIWVTAGKQGLRTASAYWPETDAVIDGMSVTYFKRYVEEGDPTLRVHQVLRWLDLPLDKRPQLVMLYFDQVDNAGHRSGPDSKRIIDSEKKVDEAIKLLMDGIHARHLTQPVSVIFVSDHGMEAVDPKRVINLMQFIRKEDLFAITSAGSPVVAVYPKPRHLQAVYQALKNAPAPMQVFLGSEIPHALHYQYPKRTPPILCVAAPHALIVDHAGVIEKGAHGYDSNLLTMHGIFVATGPCVKTKTVMPAFQNTNLYPLFAELLNLDPAKTDSVGMPPILFDHTPANALATSSAIAGSVVSS